MAAVDPLEVFVMEGHSYVMKMSSSRMIRSKCRVVRSTYVCSYVSKMHHKDKHA
jgi:hypothetical protein